MRILTLGGKLLVEGLRGHGHEVLALGSPGTINHPLDRETDFFRSPQDVRAEISGLADSFRPDWILQVDDSLPLPHLGLEDIRVPKAWVAVDTHLHWEWHRHYAPIFDQVFCAQLNQIPILEAHRSGVEWLPLCFSDEPAFLPWNLREHEVSFVGTLDASLNPARVELLARLASLGAPVRVVQGVCGPVYRASRIVINQSVKDDLNARFFEAMGHGALLITDRLSHSHGRIGEPGRDFLVYEPGDAEDLHSKIRWALEHPGEAEAMARRGHSLVVSRHMLGHRIGKLVDALAAAAPAAGGPATVPSRGRCLSHLAAAQEHLSRLALPGHVVEFFASEARRNALLALQASPLEAFAFLTLAHLDLEKGAYAEALEWLTRSGEGESGAGPGTAEAGYRQRYLFLKALLLAHNGRMPEARQAVLAGRREFPGDGDLARLAAALGS